MNRKVSDGNDVLIENGLIEASEVFLVSSAQSGDADAFVELSRRHSTRLLRTIYRITKNWQDAEDVLQDSLLKAFSHLNDFKGKSSFATWLTRIAINSALMMLRKKRGHYEIPIDDINGFDDPSGRYESWQVESLTEDPESHVVRKEKEELLRDAILRLPPVFREVIHLRQGREYSTREISQVLGISVSAVKSRLSRAKVTLRAAMPLSDLQPY